MDYYNDAQVLSNSTVIDLDLIDELGELIDYNLPFKPLDLLNLARLTESLILSNEVVVRTGEIVVGNDSFIDFDFAFTKNLIMQLSDGFILREGVNCASSALASDYHNFDKRSSQIAATLDALMNKPTILVDSFYPNVDTVLNQIEYEIIRADEIECAEKAWENMTAFYGIPFLTSNARKNIFHANKRTNISLDLYHRIENYYSRYFEEISKYLGPTFVRIPFLFSLVLQECPSLEEFPSAIMYVRDRFGEFISESTQIEIEIRTAKTIFQQAKLLQTLEDAYTNIANKYNSKLRVRSRAFDFLQSIKPEDLVKSALKHVRDLNVEENGLILIPGYYDLWQATEDIEQALPHLKRLFGPRIDNIFLAAFSESVKQLVK